MTGRAACLEAPGAARALGDPELLAQPALAYGAVFVTGGVDPVLVSLLEQALAGLPDLMRRPVITDERAHVPARCDGATPARARPAAPSGVGESECDVSVLSSQLRRRASLRVLRRGERRRIFAAAEVRRSSNASHECMRRTRGMIRASEIAQDLLLVVIAVYPVKTRSRQHDEPNSAVVGAANGPSDRRSRHRNRAKLRFLRAHRHRGESHWAASGVAHASCAWRSRWPPWLLSSGCPTATRTRSNEPRERRSGEVSSGSGSAGPRGDALSPTLISGPGSRPNMRAPER